MWLRNGVNALYRIFFNNDSTGFGIIAGTQEGNYLISLQMTWFIAYVELNTRPILAVTSYQLERENNLENYNYSYCVSWVAQKHNVDKDFIVKLIEYNVQVLIQP